METLNAADPSELLPGTQVGCWRVVSRRGGGSYGVVYQVEKVGHPEEGPYALKLALHPLDPRFEREGELLLRLKDAHVPRLEARGWVMLAGGLPFPYLVMEWVEGVSLYEWASQERRTSRQVMGLLAQVACAVAATHAVEGVHRDIKGLNILVTHESRAMLMDFGSGNYRGARPLTWQPPPPGTPQYQSPEALRFQWENLRNPKARYEAGPADDVYALGMTAYRLVTGTYPEAQEGFGFRQPVLVPVEKQARVGPELAVLIQQMLSAEPSTRGSAAALAEALDRAAKTAGAQADEPITRLPTPAPAVPKASTLPWRQTSSSGSSRFAVAVGVAVMLGAWWSENWPWEAEMAQEASDGGAEDAGTVGLADTVRSIPMPVEQPAAERSVIGLEMPKKPFPGQRRAPCEHPEIEINGGCWVRLGDANPPCGVRTYEWKKGCYLPMFEPPQPATSDPPNNLRKQ